MYEKNELQHACDILIGYISNIKVTYRNPTETPKLQSPQKLYE